MFRCTDVSSIRTLVRHSNASLHRPPRGVNIGKSSSTPRADPYAIAIAYNRSRVNARRRGGASSSRRRRGDGELREKALGDSIPRMAGPGVSELCRALSGLRRRGNFFVGRYDRTGPLRIDPDFPKESK